MYSIWHVQNRTAPIDSSMEWYSCVLRHCDSLFWGWLHSFFYLMRTILEEMSVKIHKVKKIASHDKSRAGNSFSFISILGSWLTLWEHCFFFFSSPVSFKIREISHSYLWCFSCFSQIYNFLQSTIRNYFTWIFKMSLKYSFIKLYIVFYLQCLLTSLSHLKIFYIFWTFFFYL